MVRQPHTTTTSAAATTATTTTAAAASTTASLLLSPPKRKKGRPSLHDLQQRKLFHQQQQQQQHLRNNIDDDDDDDVVDDDDIDDHRRRRRRRNPNSMNSIDSLPRRVRSSRRTSNLSAKFLLGSDSDTNSEPNSPANSDSDDERASKKVRRLSSSSKNPQINFHISQDDEKGSKAIDTHNETRMFSGPTNASISASASATVLPDKKLLLLLLDKLQKKDTRGVFAEPVDPEELPDYHEVIEKPMDFGTVRSNLINGRYKTLEQFQEDVYLISSNAMQYNPPSTVFFRQARSIQELAKKEFEALRHDAGLSEPPSKPRRGRPPGSRNLKKLLESSPVDHAVSNSPSDTTPTPTPTPTLASVPAPAVTPTPSSREDDATRSGSYNLRKGPSLYRFPRRPDNSLDFSASSSRHLSSTKYGKKPCVSEENRRDTYISSQSDDTSQDTLAAFGGSDRQLVRVSLASDNHSYARSLARFAADLGPVVWNIVSKKLRSILPLNVNFGPGWVEETPLPDNSVQSSSLLQDLNSNNRSQILTPGFEISTFAPKHSASCSESFTGVERSREWSSLNGINGGMTPGSIIHPPMNNFSSGLNSQFPEGLVRPTSSPFFNLSQPPKAFAVEPSAFDMPSTSAAVNNLQSPPLDYHGMMNPEIDMGTHGMQYWKNLSMQERWDQPYPPEFSGGFQASSSRNSGGLQIGSPPQLDLVLQL